MFFSLSSFVISFWWVSIAIPSGSVIICSAVSYLLLILLNIILISELRFLSINLICLCICLVKQILKSSYCVPGIRFDNVFFMNDTNTCSYKVEGKENDCSSLKRYWRQWTYKKIFSFEALSIKRSRENVVMPRSTLGDVVRGPFLQDKGYFIIYADHNDLIKREK